MMDEPHRLPPQSAAQPAQNLQATAAAVDLYAFVRSLPDGGRMSLEDSQILADWAERYKNAALPSRERLWGIVGKALSSGVIGAEDRTWLYFAVDPALPRQLRRVVQWQRLLAEVRDARMNGDTCESVSFDFLLAGSHLFGYRERVQSRLAVRSVVRFARDEKPIDVNDRIRIELETGECVGFVPVDDAPLIASELMSHGKAEGVVKKIIADGLFPIPVIGTRVPYKAADVEVPVPIDAWREPEQPAPPREQPAKSPLSAITRALGATFKPVTDLFR